ncbi:MAG: Fic family protein [Vicingaceae bacterium]
MKPPYHISQNILQLISSISEKIGAIEAVHLSRPPTELRKKNRIKSIQSSLEIEGNVLSENQITALIECKRVIAPQKDILEVENAIRLYDQLQTFNCLDVNSLFKAHKILMRGLIENAGNFRTKNVGIIKGSKVEHMAPKSSMVKALINSLFDYLGNYNDISLIKSCVFHYEFEFIHPFSDGNGRIGRLWQNLILMRDYPVFEILPVENMVKRNQEDYYASLAESDKTGHSTPFIEFMLLMIDRSLEELQQTRAEKLTTEKRLMKFKGKQANKLFSRKDYLQLFKEISQATASRDLKWGVEKNILIKTGDKRKTSYQFH